MSKTLFIILLYIIFFMSGLNNEINKNITQKFFLSFFFTYANLLITSPYYCYVYDMNIMFLKPYAECAGHKMISISNYY
jgi:hypothetical protein